MQHVTHYEQGCKIAQVLTVRKDANGEYLKTGVSMEKFYASVRPCKSCENKLINSWVAIPETELIAK